ncbi:MAG: mechanosensitive ion channel family protein [Prevotellaceae bacterium]|nr:mechanosensitive ion channel family protein [Prevotellaceae bacterium]
MKKRIFFILIGLLLAVLPSHAVLKEANIDTALYILRVELANEHLDLEKQGKAQKAQRLAMVNEIGQIMNQANQNAVMLYSQRSGYIFDLTYACHQATEQYNRFRMRTEPFKRTIYNKQLEVARYDSLISNLSSMPTIFMSKRATIDRNVCLTLAVNIRRQLEEQREEQQQFVRFYNMAEQRLKHLNDYAIARYNDIQRSLISNENGNYFKTLFHLGSDIHQAKVSVSEKYKPVGLPNTVTSQWDVRIIIFLFIVIIFYAVVAMILSTLSIRVVLSWLFRHGKLKRFFSEENNGPATRTFKAIRPCLVMAATVVTFAIILNIIRVTVNQNFIIMASSLLTNYSWLLAVILLSLILRYTKRIFRQEKAVERKIKKREKLEEFSIKAAFQIYTPLITMGFFVFTVRIVLIPNDLINLIFPPLMLLCWIWQGRAIHRHKKDVLQEDKVYVRVTLVVFLASVIASWLGYTLFSVVMLIWWIMQLSCILTITCVRDWLESYGERRKMDELPLSKRWLYSLVKEVLVPTAAVLTILVSIYWAADVFNLSDTVWMVFTHHYVDIKQISFSLLGVCQAVILYFLFSFINHTAKEMLKLYYLKKESGNGKVIKKELLRESASRNVLGANAIQVLVWGVWLLVVLAMFHVSNSWILVISGGLSTGVGFAMKDILENIYYGISLMSGRVKIGDYIVCDGIRGRVSNISYTSTMLEAIDGSVITFQNSQLFTKNYKNMTKNHGYELDILDVGVAYGTNIKEVKQLLTDAILSIPDLDEHSIDRKKGVNVVLKEFGDNSINLKILVWVDVLKQYSIDGRIMECVYETLNKNNIEIPFPQREVTIKNQTNE